MADVATVCRLSAILILVLNWEVADVHGKTQRLQRRDVPRFSLQQYIIHNVTANTKRNTQLISLPAYGGQRTRYSVSSPRLLRVDSDGNVFTRVPGSQLLHPGIANFTIYAVSPDSPTQVASAVVRLDGNHPPRFSDDTYTANVYENAAEGALVRAVMAQDPDTDSVSYFIRPPNTRVDTEEYQMFTINRQTGVIRLVSRPFAFMQEDYSFTVVARDTHDQNDTATVHVHIIDVNNNRPQFLDCDNYRPEVEENRPADTLVLTVKATDADKGVNAELVYSLVTSPSFPDSFFNINQLTGKLTTNKKFNRDAPDHEKELRVIVKAKDKGTPSLEGTCAFILNVLDVNDNSPLFDKKSYLKGVALDTEPVAAVERVSATDDDIGDNGAIMYSLKAHRPDDEGFFTIESRTGIISLARSLSKLDIEYEFHLVAEATDLGSTPRSAEAPVIITVKDSNARPPSFTVLPNNTYYLPENYRDTETPIARLKAVSNLLGSSTVFYDMVHGSQEQTNKFRTFVVDKDGDGGAIVRYGGSRQLNYEQVTAYNLTVVATTEQNTRAEVTFQVLLQDKNDEVPIFYDTNQITILENSPPGTFVTVAEAVDRDSTSPNNQLSRLTQVSYRLDRNSDEYQLFSIESGTGKVSTRVKFDREDLKHGSPFYTVTVIAEDGAHSDIRKTSEPNQAKQRITVEIGDENDNAPSFDPNGIYKASVVENADTGSKVIDVIAQDVDDDSKIKYQITDGNYDATFDIDPDTGVVTVKNKIDYETVKQYTITVTASDGRAEATQQVDIEVINVNDEPPTFDQDSYELEMREGYLSNLPIIKVKATDPDPLGEPSILYQLSGPGMYPGHPKDDVFSISADGMVVVLKTLDRDEGTGGREVWDLSVEAWDDSGSGSTVPFRLTLTDINDNAPYLIQSNTSIAVIMENKPPKGIVIPVEAEDFDDHAKNGPPYSFTLDPDAPSDILSKFEVKTVRTDTADNRAEIRPLNMFDREAKKQYVIPVIVSDNPAAEPHSLTGTSLFTVIIGDENDNDMHPGSSVIQVFNFEGKMPDTVVGRIFVEDLDDWDMPDKTFSWQGDPDTHHFQLDQDTGSITMKYGTSNGTYPLKFKVHDKKFDSNVMANVTIEVRLLPREAVEQSGSIRIKDVTAEQFVSSPAKNARSVYSTLTSELAQLFGTSPRNVDMFGVQNNDAGGVDVRYAVHGSPYYRRERMDGVVAENKKKLEETLKIQIEQIGINDCIYEKTCRGSCYSELIIYDGEPHTVLTNRSSIVGVRTEMQYTCGECEKAPSQSHCLNGATPSNIPPYRCVCPDGFSGSHCEGLTIHFKGAGYAWFSHLTACNASHLSFDLTTSQDAGLIMYNGPMAEPTTDVQDFFAVDLLKGRLRVFVNYGTGTAVASAQIRVDDGRRHRVDVEWSTEVISVRVDSCKGMPVCQDSIRAPSASGVRNAFLNVATPLQLGGSAVSLDRIRPFMAWVEAPGSAGFFGCLENVTFLSQVYDLSNPAYGEEYSSYCDENILPVPVIYASSSFLAVVLCSLLFVLAMILAVFVVRRRRSPKSYTELPSKLGQSINIAEEGDFEKDNNLYDLSTLQMADAAHKENGTLAGVAERPSSTAGLLDDRRKAADADEDAAWPADDVRNYAYEGGGSSAGSLSSINSGTTDGDQDFNYLQELGPRFRRLADMYDDDGVDVSDDDADSRFHVPSSAGRESWC